MERALAEQRSRIGLVRVETNVPGAAITVDGVTAGTAPLETPLRLAVGEYRLGAESAGWQGPTQLVTVAGETEQSVTLTLNRLVTQRGSLRLTSQLEGVEVRIDGELVGRTPFDRTFPVDPGSHVIEGRRPGYVPYRRSVEVSEEQSLDVAITMEIDEADSENSGRLRVALPNAPASVRVDGVPTPVVDGVVRVPRGDHQVVVEVQERRLFQQGVQVPAGQTASLTPTLWWTDEARARRVEDADIQRTAGWVVTIGGLATIAAAIGLMVYSETKVQSRLDDNRESHNICTDPSRGGECGIEQQRESESYDSDDQLQQILRITYGVGAGLGVVATAVGVVLILTSPSEEEIDAAASVALNVGPGTIGVRGRFP